MRRMLFTIVLLHQPLFGADPPRTDAAAATPPVAPVRPHPVTVNGDTFTDNYFWLRNKKDPATIQYLEAENAYTSAVTKSVQPFADKIYKEFLSRIKQTDLSVPFQHRGWWYYSRDVEGQQYAIRCRKKGSLDAREEIVLDGNELAKGQKYMGLAASSVSDDGTRLAYLVDFTGFREYQLYVKDLTTGKLLTEKPLAQASDLAWAADNKTLYYVTDDAAKRPHKLWRQTLGEETPTLLFEEKDELYRLSVGRSRDDKFVFLHSNCADADEWQYLAADQPTGAFQIVVPREHGHEYSVEHNGGAFYLATNRGAKNYRVVTAPTTVPSRWSELIPHRPNVFIDGIQLFQRYLIVIEREEGIPYVAVTDLETGKQHRVSMPEPVYSVMPSANPEFNTSKLRFVYTSLVTPTSVYEYDLATRERKLLKRTEVLGGYDPAQYSSERIYATASDGVRVPISLVYKKGFVKDGTGAAYLTGYGAYGATLPVAFSPLSLSYLDRGLVVAFAHIRGGKDLGQDWHDQGKMLQKRNTFTDFIACADHLVSSRYCSRDRLAISGASAGGLLIGATLNIRPDVCKAAILEVPFVDVINTMLDESLPLTVGEFLEWGNPKNRTEYEYMKSYCPYTNLKRGDYPAMLVTTSLNDSQVLYHEPAKYVAKLRTLKTENRPLLFKCNMAAGHGGSSGRYDNLKEKAFQYAFVLDQVGALR